MKKCVCGGEIVAHGLCKECIEEEKQERAEHRRLKLAKMARKAERMRGEK